MYISNHIHLISMAKTAHCAAENAFTSNKELHVYVRHIKTYRHCNMAAYTILWPKYINNITV